MTSAPTIDRPAATPVAPAGGRRRLRQRLGSLRPQRKERTLSPRESVFDLWDAMDQPVTGRHVPGTALIVIVAMLCGVAATVFAWRQDWLLLISDIRSHLVIARAVTDSINPGFYQLGTVWLPFPHIALIPLTMIFPLWQTGLAGSILGVACLGISAGAIWRITGRVGMGRTGRLAAVGIFVLNPSMLYFSSTAMTEPVLYACWLAALAGLAGWITANPQLSPGALATFAGLPTAGAVLSRYEGWAFAIAASVFIVIASWRRWRQARYTVILVVSYLGPTIGALIWWFGYNFIRFGDPLEFARGPYSAGSEAATRASLGMLPTKGNLGLDLTVFHYAAGTMISIPILLAAVAGGLLLIYQRGFSTTALLVWLAAFPYPFILLSLYLGQTIIVNAEALQGQAATYNNRFVMGILPICAMLTGFLVDSLKRWRRRVGTGALIVVLVYALGFCVWSYSDAYHRMLTIREGINTAIDPNALAAGKWLTENYEGGRILLDSGARGDALLFGLTNDQLITVDNGPVFEAALADPGANTEWVFVNTANPRATVLKRFEGDQNFLSRFNIAYQAGNYIVYKNINSVNVDQ